MRLAFFIATYKLERQFSWLFNAIKNSDDLFVLHVSEAEVTDAQHAALRELWGCPNVHILPRMQLAWGGWSLCEMHLRALHLLQDLGEQWSYFINLSSQDYPARPIDELREFLRANSPRNFIDVREIDQEPEPFRRHLKRRRFWHCVERDGKLIRLPIPNLQSRPFRVAWYGPLWCMLSRDFCDWILSSGAEQDCRRTLNHMKLPDEFFFQTLVMNSPFRSTIDPNTGRFIKWDGQRSPMVITPEAYDELVASQAFFARKFDEAVNDTVLYALAERVGAQLPSHVSARPSSRASASLPSSAAFPYGAATRGNEGLHSRCTEAGHPVQR